MGPPVDKGYVAGIPRGQCLNAGCSARVGQAVVVFGVVTL